MGELTAETIGVLVRYAALVKGGTSPLTWALYRRRLTRALTGCPVTRLPCPAPPDRHHQATPNNRRPAPGAIRSTCPRGDSHHDAYLPAQSPDHRL
ncbi:hypothetical protein Vqi01_55370 [Micromonospora qiuiae]|uniref:Integrase SAM-like N-terminal domain-containing protein n=1 Tax=Micromonospora qiuiae TaxID=502268 RepID=A0ABQ4JLN7_9ACTN|nr:hypothetical protein Vqi01_55370 [Micromonospora qiuiae]